MSIISSHIYYRISTALVLIPLVLIILIYTPFSPLLLILLNCKTLQEYCYIDPYCVYKGNNPKGYPKGYPNPTNQPQSIIKALCAFGSVLPLFISQLLQLLQPNDTTTSTPNDTTASTTTSTHPHNYYYPWSLLAISVTPFMLLYCALMRPNPATATPTTATLSHLLSVTLTLLGYTCMHLLLPAPRHAVNLCLMTWGVDTLGLLGGKAFGGSPFKRRLNAGLAKLRPFAAAARRSPTKTPTGYITALGMAHVLALATHSLCMPSMPTGPPSGPSVSFSFAFSLSCVVGDLYQSSQKRLGGVKESGDAIRGHGGVWDRMDSMIASAVVYWAWPKG
mmetsp:Transcript_9144/g.18304  ORF Transcript_9144/g.18304 Transcript_9144/m.18304 type:complete len:335 (-) Transcript_9144:57-1061(-)